MSRVCVTGAAGFIAGHVIVDLLDDGMGKTQSERLLWEFADKHADRVQAVAINPSVVIGRPLAH